MASLPDMQQGNKRGGVITVGAALVALVGPATATLLLTEVPREESGRKVAVTIAPKTGAATIQHISGPQYLRVYLDMLGSDTT